MSSARPLQLHWKAGTMILDYINVSDRAAAAAFGGSLRFYSQQHVG